VTFHGVTATFKIVSDTKITATAPKTVSTGTLSVTTPGGTGTSATSFTVTPGMSLSRASGPPLAAVEGDGAGFHKNTAVDVYFDTVDLALTVSTNDGVVAAQVQIPDSAQPGTHWVTLVERGSNFAAQSAFLVSTDWPMMGFGFRHAGFNPRENTIDVSNVSMLNQTWTAPAGGFANPSPFVEYGGSLFVGDVKGEIHAYSNTGSLLWTASPGSSLQYVNPVAVNGKVFFGADNGNVYAYNATCHSDGSVCSPTWTKSVGTAVTGSLSLFNGLVYAPSSDGTIHPLNPSTGAAGTPIYGFDTVHGAVTTPITFGPNGNFYYGNGSVFQYRFANGTYGYTTYGGTVSSIVFHNGAAYFTTSDGLVHNFLGTGWSANTSTGGCAPPPVAVGDTVYAGGCTTISAFEAGRGTLLWTLTTPGQVFGLSFANNVLYACVGGGGGFGGYLTAYTYYGSQLWIGGLCDLPPVIANGTLYGTYADISAYNTPDFAPSAMMARPAPAELAPDYRLLPQPQLGFSAGPVR
jgi:hypothetical protein